MIWVGVAFAVYAVVVTVLLVSNHGAHKRPTPRPDLNEEWERIDCDR